MTDTGLPLSARLRWMEEGCSDKPGPGYMNEHARATLLEAANAADRLAQIERQVLYRTADTPEWAEMWEKCRNGQCLWDARDARAPEIAPDFRPNDPGPLSLLIISAETDTGERT